ALITDELIDERMKNALAEGVLGKTKTIFDSLFNPAFRESYVPLWAKAQTVTTKTLLLWGRDDRMIPYDQAHFATRWMPEVELHTFAHCGHWIQIERKSDFERVVTEFLTRDVPLNRSPRSIR
ncbi:MAG: alpha/beta hydrolase, partial [Gordonia sp.]|nr:alpha/beta hydrolase [Gordonia sp. (in: high G+C Gram-positive bacteria)]